MPSLAISVIVHHLVYLLLVWQQRISPKIYNDESQSQTIGKVLICTTVLMQALSSLNPNLPAPAKVLILYLVIPLSAKEQITTSVELINNAG